MADQEAVAPFQATSPPTDPLELPHEMHAILASHSARNSRTATPSPSRPTFMFPPNNHAREESTNQPRGLSGLGYLHDDDEEEESELLPNDDPVYKGACVLDSRVTKYCFRMPKQGPNRKVVWKLGVSFFLFGLINNVLYVIILSAALDLVPPSTPKGVIAFCNIAPALAAKVGWPYILKGRIFYVQRLIGCCMLSVLGLVVVAFFDGLYMRLLGIGLASFSSGLGELTFLQLSTTYAPPSVAGQSVGAFASGTGAAGLFGAFLWWELRGLGVRTGVGLSSIMPFVIPLTYFLLLPHPSAFLPLHSIIDVEDTGAYGVLSTLPFTPNAATYDGEGEEEPSAPAGPKTGISLTAKDKWRLVKPLLPKYMIPLFFVYMLEYTINQGIAPTLLYAVPDPNKDRVLSKIIHSIRDYYPFWQLVYQTTVFFSRSSITMGLPAIPEQYIRLPAIVQFFIFSALFCESLFGFFKDDAEWMSITLVFLLISLEGICGGLAYVNVFYRINQERPDPASSHDIERTRQEREFKIGSIGFADSSGILIASLLAMPVEFGLCKAQVGRGKTFCKGL